MMVSMYGVNPTDGWKEDRGQLVVIRTSTYDGRN